MKSRGYGLRIRYVLGLDGFDGEAELCGDIVAEICDVGCYLSFVNEGKSPAKMCEIIEQSKVILITRYTGNRGMSTRHNEQVQTA